MLTRRYTFQVVKLQVKKSSKCQICGKRKTRQTTFSQTINPYNKNSNGSMKNCMEIHTELVAEANAWKKIPIECCEPAKGR